MNIQEEFKRACRRGDVHAVKRFLDDDSVDFYPCYNYAIAFASENGHTEILKLILIDSRANPSVDDNLAIRRACIMGHTETVRLLLKDGRADPSAKNNATIFLASLHGHTDIIKLLLADKRVNPKGEEGIRLEYIHTCVDIVLFDNVLYRVENENVDYIENPEIRERYIKWLYRIGGEKWSQARNSVEN